MREFCVSHSHPELLEDVPDALLPNAIELLVTCVQPIRDIVGKTTILSGYRSKRLNAAVGGSPTSQHMQAEAADLTAEAMNAKALFAAIRTNAKHLRLGQCILYPDAGFVHVALPTGKYTRPSFFVSQGGIVLPA